MRWPAAPFLGPRAGFIPVMDRQEQKGIRVSQEPSPESEPPADATPPLDPERRRRVDQARKSWMDQLIDRSRRNNLVYFRDLKTGTLDLTEMGGEALAALLREEPVPLGRLFPDTEQTRVRAVLREIHRRALANLEEKGLQTLFLAVGMATWPAGDGGRDAEAPILLVPVRIEWRGRDAGAAALARAGEAQINLVLLHALEVEHGCRLTPETLLPEAEDEAEAEDAGGPAEKALDSAVFARLEAAAQEVRGFAIKPRMVLGNFSFQKMAMVRDLQEFGEPMAAHDVIAALAGDDGATGILRAADRVIDERELDRVAPDLEFLVRDADASQQAVVAAAQGARALVVQGPPGTGKSQTIVNLITTLAAEGRRILFVAEKRAALDVVRGRLRDAGLEHLALDLHGADLSRRTVMEGLRAGLSHVYESVPVDSDDL